MRTYTEKDEERFNQVLRDIQGRIPEALKKGVAIEKKLTPTIEMVLTKALESPTISEEKKSQIRNLLEAGVVSKVVVGENDKIAKQVDNFVAREINKAIKLGQLPPKSHIKYLPSIIKLQNENQKDESQ